MSTGILSDILADILLIVDLLFPGILLIVDLAIWFLDFGGKKKRGFLPLSLFSVSICRLVCLMLVGMYHL